MHVMHGVRQPALLGMRIQYLMACLMCRWEEDKALEVALVQHWNLPDK